MRKHVAHHLRPSLGGLQDYKWLDFSISEDFMESFVLAERLEIKMHQGHIRLTKLLHRKVHLVSSGFSAQTKQAH